MAMIDQLWPLPQQRRPPPRTSAGLQLSAKLVKSCLIFQSHLDYFNLSQLQNHENILQVYPTLKESCSVNKRNIQMDVLKMYPFRESFCLKASLAASLIAFSGVTRVRLTAAPSGGKQAIRWKNLPLSQQNRITSTSSFGYCMLLPCIAMSQCIESHSCIFVCHRHWKCK